VQFVEGLWDKYRVTLTNLRNERIALEDRLGDLLSKLSYL